MERVNKIQVDNNIRLDLDFCINSGAIAYFITKKSLFPSYTTTNRTACRGSANKIKIIDVRNIIIRFRETTKISLLKECLFIPELGMNITYLTRLDNEIRGLSRNKKLFTFKDKSLSIYTKALLYNELH